MAGSLLTEAVRQFVAALNELGIRYFAGGSVASSIHGTPRFTQDLDLVADLREEQVDLLAARLGPAFYADAKQMSESLCRGRSFNVIHLASGFKIDIFPMHNSPFHASELARSEPRMWDTGSRESVELQVASAEDVLLQKLVWYRQGGGTSDRQWNDALGMATTRPLDWIYLRDWAARLQVSDLLDKLSEEAGQIGNV